MKTIIIFLLVLIKVFSINAQGVVNSSYITNTGEKVLRFELSIPVKKNIAWKYFTTDTLLQKWIAPVAHIELKTGGYIITNYDKSKPLTDSSSIKLEIINYLEETLITLKVKLNGNFPISVQQTDQHLQELIQFIDLENGETKIISSMIGWGQGSEWEATYKKFVFGNDWTYKELKKIFTKGNK